MVKKARNSLKIHTVATLYNNKDNKKANNR